MSSCFNYFAASPTTPYHLSVGAVVLDKEKKVCCHHFEHIRGAVDVYTLMRETVEPQESLEETLARGLQEEFGTNAVIKAFVGSINCDCNEIYNKTTLYFLCDLVNIDVNLRNPHDPESGSCIEWHDINFLIEKMKEQIIRYPSKMDLDESVILERVKIYIKTDKIVT